MASDEWAPHAEKEWGRLTHALGKTLPRRLTDARRIARQTAALTSTKPQRKGR